MRSQITARLALYTLIVAVLVAGCAGRGPDPVVRVTPAAAEVATSTPAALQTVVPIAPPPTDSTPTGSAPTDEAAPAVAPTSAPTAEPTAPRDTATPKRSQLRVSVAPDASPVGLERVLAALAAQGLDAQQVDGEADLQWTAQGSGADAAVADGSAVGNRAAVAFERILTPVDRMSSVLESITLDELRGVWTGAAASPNFSNIYVAGEDMAGLAAVLGEAGSNVIVAPGDDVDAAVWGDPMGLGILPFDRLTVRLRAITLGRSSPVDNRFVHAEWPLTTRTYLAPLTERGDEALASVMDALPLTNRDANRLTVLVMTGVTAMARNSAVAIERSGDWGFLAQRVGPELAAADITIISNEIPFIPDCVADNSLNNLILCSRPEYWANLELSGVDAVGLTGNHQNDFGYDAMHWSLGYYKEKGIPVYGGGADDVAARRPLILEQNGNRLGFIGANEWGPEWYPNGRAETVSAWASKDWPGSARFSLEQMQADIAALKPQVGLVFAEVQHTEFNDAGDYQTEPIAKQEKDFRGMIDAGADVVTGVMAHAPQAVEFYNGKLILYGLGNLYFDQTWSWPTRTGLVARHTIYDGQLINTELLVTVIENNFQLRWATPEERMQVLKTVFDASRW